jgi:cyclic pyranopterin monophosphate synthase
MVGTEIRMIDVGAKSATLREAVAFARLVISPEVREKLSSLPKGDALACARVAGIMAGKKTADIIPLCHPLGLDSVQVDFRVIPEGLMIRATARTTAKTGVEMEAMTAASVAALTVYDMAKSQDQAMEIGPVFLGKKTGGKSDYQKKGIEPWL